MYEEIRPLQLKQLEVLKEMKRICNKHNIPYFLSYGTLIGAVRHKGFIPWDDDIDTALLYSDYIKFEKICKKELSQDYFLQTRDTEPKANLCFDKLRMNGTTLIIDNMLDKDIHHGIDIDIQPIYNVPDDILHRKIQLINAMMYMLLQTQHVPANHNGIVRLGAKFILFFLRGKVREKIKRKCFINMAKYEGEKTKYKAKLFGNIRICKTLYPAEAFSSAIEVPFEDDSFSIPIGYEAVLKKYYGEYMILPPVEKQGMKLEHIVKFDPKNNYDIYKGILYCRNEK